MGTLQLYFLAYAPMADYDVSTSKYAGNKRAGLHTQHIRQRQNEQQQRKSLSFHGSDYEDCRLLEYKNPVRTSQETQYVSATEHSQLMLRKI
jgi:hypothetical protein